MNSKTLLPYKILLVKDGGYIYSKGYRLFEYDDAVGKSTWIGTIPDRRYGLLAKLSLTRRFFRAEITGLYELNDGSLIAIAKKGLFKKAAGLSRFNNCFSVPRGSRPLNLCILPNGHIFFGEYFMNMEKKSVNVYHSVNGGESWSIAYTFAEGNINHIHGLFYDKYTERMWCLTGDRENECIIGYTEDEFKTFVEVFRGGQEYRACQLFFYPEYIIYATDSQYMQNVIKKVDRKTLEITPLYDIQGTAIKGKQVGEYSMLSTTVEPSEVNKDTKSHLWFSKNGTNWNELFSAEKDLYPAILQFGSIEFPNYQTATISQVCCSGRALKGFDGKSMFIKI